VALLFCTASWPGAWQGMPRVSNYPYTAQEMRSDFDR
jgi:hypothetical protein